MTVHELRTFSQKVLDMSNEEVEQIIADEEQKKYNKKFPMIIEIGLTDILFFLWMILGICFGVMSLFKVETTSIEFYACVAAVSFGTALLPIWLRIIGIDVTTLFNRKKKE